MDQRREFVALALCEGANVSRLCARFGISRDTGHKWLRRAQAGDVALEDRSRRPLTSPLRCDEAMEAAVLAVRDAHPAWGARKLSAVLVREGIVPPAFSTVHSILERHGRIRPAIGGARAACRFEMAAPNQLWQMDFKGHFPLGDGSRCDPLTVVDDHSRFNVCLKACANQQTATVRGHLTETFERYGRPEAIFVDNGSPWGPSSTRERWTRLGVWLLKLGVDVWHSRPAHPQSRGKNERFHRTLKAELLQFTPLDNLQHAQRAFDSWRNVYNIERPHQALDLDVPASRYQPSPRSMPDAIPEIHYDSHETVRTVPKTKSYVSFRGRSWKVPKAFAGEHVAIRPTNKDGRYNVCFGARTIATIDFNS